MNRPSLYSASGFLPSHQMPPTKTRGVPYRGRDCRLARRTRYGHLGRTAGSRALLLLAVQTGLRNSEITSLKREDVGLGTGAHVRCLGKGRKLRCTPLRPDVVAVLKEWMLQQGGDPADPVFPSSRGGRLSADAMQRLVLRHVTTARRTVRHREDQEGNPAHAPPRHGDGVAPSRSGSQRYRSLARTRVNRNDSRSSYMKSMQLKERALAHANPSGLAPDRFRPTDPLLAFLESL